jgi:hypothetical protein
MATAAARAGMGPIVALVRDRTPKAAAFALRKRWTS